MVQYQLGGLLQMTLPALGIHLRIDGHRGIDYAQIVAFDGDSQKLEGSPGHQTIVLSFETMEAAKEIYESGDYQKLIPVRHEATSNHFAVLINGIG